MFEKEGPCTSVLCTLLYNMFWLKIAKYNLGELLVSLISWACENVWWSMHILPWTRKFLFTCNARTTLCDCSKVAYKSAIPQDWDFNKMGIGGLDKEFSDIFRRAFASRVFPPDVVEQIGMWISCYVCLSDLYYCANVLFLTYISVLCNTMMYVYIQLYIIATN